MDVLQALFRWIHIVAGIVWIGHLYFFNWVNAPFAATLDAESKKKVVPELIPRALFWFRWGAVYTWVTGVLLLAMIYYHHSTLEYVGRNMFSTGGEWGPLSFALVALVFVSPFIYDALYKGPLKDPKVGFVGGLVLVAAMVFAMAVPAAFSYRSYAIHLGTMFGTIMAFNVWFRIWPAQKQIIAAVKEGKAPDAGLVAMAGARSKHNTYMSVPLVFMMISQHATWFADPILLTGVVLVGWLAVYRLYDLSKTVKGF